MEEYYLGWQIIKKLTNHNKLSNVGDIEVEKMYNPLYVQAYEFLKSNFNIIINIVSKMENYR